jgi:type III restriction enzyme
MSKHPSLDFAHAVTDRANAAWDDGSFLESVTLTTRTLLTYWFDSAFADLRGLNFHVGQRQAILNAVYIHEVLKKERVLDVYEAIAPHLLLERGSGLEYLSDAIYNHPKYAMKMATGTGKTWVLQALLIWQYLNARHEAGNYTKNFLVVAPGLIVYERLLDAFLGKLQDDGATRDFETSDLHSTQDLFIPDEYRDEVFGFLRSSVAAKTEIGSKVTGDGLIAITNYHLLMGVEEGEFDEDDAVAPEIDSWQLPVSPGVSAGNSLDTLDAGLGRKKELEFLARLPDLMVMNDEAHHIHVVKRGGETSEVEWQKSLRYIAEGKAERFIQVDFSATPYNERGKEKVYFPHIIVDFELKTAIHQGLVKTLVLDERKELATEELDYKAVRDNSGRVIDLSDGQRLMLRAGLSKLDLLAASFREVADPETKSPKLLVVCEDTEVVPQVAKFLKAEGLGDEDILEIHSNKKGEVGEEEWKAIKLKLSGLDQHARPRVVISVLMLREGFDVNNICVIVPLRSSTSGILLEQTIGRGLRLMWRGDAEIDELKRENRHRIMVEKKAATNYYDILSIVEHPAFRDFYKDLINEDLVGIEDEPPEGPGDVNGDLMTVGLRDDYEQYDFRLPLIVAESEEVMQTPVMDTAQLRPFHIRLDQMQRFVPDNEQWISTEVTKDVRFGDFEVSGGVFRATSYNDYVARLVARITDKLNVSTESVSRFKRGDGGFPALSIHTAQVAGLVDSYIRRRLFDQEFDPAAADNWKVLKVSQVIDHIVAQVSGLIVVAQEQTETHDDSQVLFTPFSSVDRLTVREHYSVELTKNIYERTPYPSNKGQYERDFMEYSDNDGAVDALAKVVENRHTFVRFRYVREDGLPAQYIPDFFVRFGDDVFIVETKAQDQLTAGNVRRKQKAALRWVQRINGLPVDKREGKTWHYVILGHATFYDWKNKRMGVREMLAYAELRNDADTDFTGRMF